MPILQKDELNTKSWTNPHIAAAGSKCERRSWLAREGAASEGGWLAVALIGLGRLCAGAASVFRNDKTRAAPAAAAARAYKPGSKMQIFLPFVRGQAGAMHEPTSERSDEGDEPHQAKKELMHQQPGHWPAEAWIMSVPFWCPVTPRWASGS